MISPKVFNLPEKYKKFRPGQLEIASKMATSSKFSYMLDAPTGVGKTMIAGTIQRIVGKGILYVCTTKQLQDQVLHDFPYARTLKGRSNYVCLRFKNAFPRITAEDCNHTEVHPCELLGPCPYRVAKREALGAPIAVLNTAYFLTEANYIGGFSGYDHVVIDEFDTIEDILMSFIEVLITQKQLDSLEIPSPKYKTKFESWVDWAKEALKVLVPRLLSLEQALEDSWQTHDFGLIREAKYLSRLVGKLKFFVKEVDASWVWYPGTDRWSFKPVWIAKYSKRYIWDHMKKFYGISATILDPWQMARNIGLEHGSFDYKVLGSPFPKENRPVYFDPVANVVRKTMDSALPKLAARITDILEKHKDDKVLIHTVSYKVMDYLKEHLDQSRVVTHTTFNRAEVLENFKADPRPRVLLSPSMDRGVDLPQEECRAIIIAKVPYPDLGDPQVNKRVYASKDGNNWYAHKTVSKIIQMAGRGVRSDTDYAATYILDGQFGRLLKDNKRFFPPWFKEALVI